MKLETKAYISDYDGECYDIELDENIFTKEEKEILKKFKKKIVKLTLETYEPILDEEERKYLSGFIKPFRDEIEYIRKVPNEYYKTEHLVIYFKDNMNMPFPYFKKGSMYKGMKVDKNYTLKGLGL